MWTHILQVTYQMAVRVSHFYMMRRTMKLMWVRVFIIVWPFLFQPLYMLFDNSNFPPQWAWHHLRVVTLFKSSDIMNQKQQPRWHRICKFIKHDKFCCEIHNAMPSWLLLLVHDIAAFEWHDYSYMMSCPLRREIWIVKKHI